MGSAGETRLDQLLLDCLRAKISLTRSRKAILRVLSESDDHPDVEEIQIRAAKYDKSVSLPTAYRNVKLFQEIGLVQKLDFGDGRARYELEPISHHDHLIDVDSGEVIEFHDHDIEKLQEKIAQKLGYELTGHRLDLYGRKVKK